MLTKRRIAAATRHMVEALESRCLLTASMHYEYNGAGANHHLDVTFDTDLHNGISGSDLSLYNVSTDTFIDAITVAFSNANKTAEFRFPTSIGQSGAAGVLPDGYYRAVISAEDVPGLAGDFVQDFSMLRGDADGNGVVNGDDYDRIWAGFNQQLTGYTNGDFNYSGTINMDDYAIIDNAWGTQVPRPPTGPNEVAVEGSGVASMYLGWIDNVTGETGWRIQRAKEGEAFEVIATIPGNADGTSNSPDEVIWYDDATNDPTHVPQDGTRYFYRVRAVSPDTAYTPKSADRTPMRKPTSLVATAVSSSSISLTWKNNSVSAVEINIERSLNGGSFEPLPAIYADGPGNQTFVDTGLVDNATYTYRLFASNNAAGQTTTYVTASPVATPLGIPDAPTNLSATSTVAARIDLTWTDNAHNESGFELQRFDPDATAWTTLPAVPQGQTSVLDPGRNSDQAYRYRVRAVNAAGASPWSDTLSVQAKPRHPEHANRIASGFADGSHAADRLGRAVDRTIGLHTELRKPRH
jgi:hypothetical protein